MNLARTIAIITFARAKTRCVWSEFMVIYVGWFDWNIPNKRSRPYDGVKVAIIRLQKEEAHGWWCGFIDEC